MATAAQGAYSRLLVEDGDGTSTPPTFDSSSETYEFLSESLQSTQSVLDTGGIRGTRTIPKERTRLGVRAVGDTIVMNPGPADLDKWLPRIMGAAEITGSDTFNLGDSFTDFWIYLDRVTDVYYYSQCYVSRATFAAQAGGLLTLSMDIVGTNETIGVTRLTSGNTPAIGVTTSHQPYVFHDADSGVTFAGTGSREITDFSLSIDNMMDARFVNSVTNTSITAMDRAVTYSATMPFDSDNLDVYRDTPRGQQAIMVFTNSGNSKALTFTMASLDGADVSPIVQGKTEIMLGLQWEARGTGGSENELTITSTS